MSLSKHLIEFDLLSLLFGKNTKIDKSFMHLFGDLFNTLLEGVRRLGSGESSAVHSGHVHFPVPLNGLSVAFLTECQLVNIVLFGDLIEILIATVRNR